MRGGREGRWMEINYVNVKGEGGREEGVVSVDHQS